MKKTQQVICRYGVVYNETLEGTPGEIWRGFNHLSKCCCFTCYNHDCKSPRDEVVSKCNNVCEVWFTKHPCENK